MKIRFWGVRGSIPTPQRTAEVESKIVRAIRGIPPGLDITDEAAVRAYVGALPPLARGGAGGNTACVSVESDDTILIIDAGSGIRDLGMELMRGPAGRGQATIHILLSHPHWDHIQGFPFFVPAFIPGNRIIFYAVHDAEAALRQQQHPLTFPISLDYMRASKEFVRLRSSQSFQLDGLRVDLLKNAHPGDAFSFRLSDAHSTFVYASDAEYKDLDEASLRPVVDFFRDADAVIFDAQYTLREAWQKVDWGHSSAMIGVDLARAAGARRLILFHHDPTYSDLQLEEIRATALTYQEQDQSRPPCEILVAYEGLALDLTPAGTVDVEILPEGEAVLRATSVFDEQGVDLIARELTQVGHSAALLDLSRVETLTTAGLKALVSLGRARGEPLVLVNPSPAVQQVLRLSGYNDFFATYPSVTAARTAARLREELNLPGHLLRGRYRIEDPVGFNQLGMALRATDTHTGQSVAIKVLAPRFSGETVGRLIRQAPLLTRLRHRGLRRVIAVEQDGETTFVVNEWVPEVLTLDLQLALEPLPPAESLAIAQEIAYGLHYLHSHGVIHGDLKPRNVFLTPMGIKLSNLGMGRLEEGRALRDTPLLLLNASYTAPEQILGQPLDARTDLYALGAMLYELFTGTPPFVGDDQSLMEAHLGEAPPAPRSLNPAISRGLEHLILKLLAKSPNDRYASAQQVAEILSCLDVVPGQPFPQRLPLAGRGDDMAQLREAWAAAAAGRGRAAVIYGAPGVGKTALAEWLACESTGAAVLAGRCHDSSADTPYGPIAELVAGYLTGRPALDDPEVREALADLAPLRAGPAPRPEADLHQARERLIGGLTRLARRATASRPWLVLIDDLQWADPGSLAIVRHLAQHMAELPLLLVITCREEPGDTRLRGVLGELSRTPGYLRLDLDRLDGEATTAMLEQIWRRAPSLDLAAAIYHHTAGNPFYIEMVARSLVDDRLVEADGEALLPPAIEIKLPPSVRESVWRRIRHLSPDTQTVLRQGAVLGPVFSFEALCATGEFSPAEALDLLDAALERQLIREEGETGRMRFSHPEIHYVLYADLGPLRRRMLHSYAARAVALGAQRPDAVAGELARHYEEAGEGRLAAEHCLAAARYAEGLYAYETALRWYDRALGLLSRIEPEAAADHLANVMEEIVRLNTLRDLAEAV